MSEPVVAIPLALLLLVNIVWSIALFRRLALLDRDGEQLREVLREFDVAVERTHRAADALRAEVHAIEQQLRCSVEGARLRSEQLGRLCAAAERHATRLERAMVRATQSEVANGERAVFPQGTEAGAAERAEPTVSCGDAKTKTDHSAPNREAAVSLQAGPPSLPRELERVLAQLR